MKGIIVMCLKELVVEKFAADKWARCMKDVGLAPNMPILVTSDISDELVLKVVGSVCSTLGLSLEDAADAFGEYWVCDFSHRFYPFYFKRFTCAKDFLLAMDKVHVDTTKTLVNARPPRFRYEWKDKKTLIMKYESGRHLIDFVVGLARGVGKHYEENIKVTKLGDDKIQVVFH